MDRLGDPGLRRTHHCGELREDDIGAEVRLCGWVRSYRDHGGVVFIDLRDREGITQVVFDIPADQDDAPAMDRYRLARSLRNEWVIAIPGKVRARGPERENPKLPTGKIEVLADGLTLLNRAEALPFLPDEFTATSEETRLRYRYIDLRRAEMTRILRLRHTICRAMRRQLDAEGFMEVETPFLTKSTPEGARDFLVPCRLRQGEFYALPQSPQLFKQILMVSGLDRYYQIVRCFRDEDLRADRQPEFTQLDLEMSFCCEQDVMAVTDQVLRAVCEAAGKAFPDSVPVIPYSQAMGEYGTDRPDLRFELKLKDVSELLGGSAFKVFASAVGEGGVVKALCPPGGGKFTRKEIDGYIAYAGEYGAKGLAWCKLEGGTMAGGVAKFLTPRMQADLREALGAEEGDLIFFSADQPALVNKVLAALRVRLARDLDLINKDRLAWCWVVDFPLVEWNADEDRWDSTHHPFTSPRMEDIDKIETDPGHVRARAYDIVCNGMELGGGSVRIHSPEIQKRVFAVLGIGEAEAHEKFDFLMHALRCGAPPHGGLALGLDRVVMLMAGAESIRDVIAFPKTQRGTCPLTGAPSAVGDHQLAELDLKVIAPPKTDEV